MIDRTRLTCLIVVAVLILVNLTCKREPPALEAIDTIDRRTNVPFVEPVTRDLPAIRERGTLVVLAPYNSTTYFIYQGEQLGYEYELLKSFAKEKGVELKMVVLTAPKSLLPLLNSGEGDLAAARLIPTPETEAAVSFSNALFVTEPV